MESKLTPFIPIAPRIRVVNDKDLEKLFFRLSEKKRLGEKPDLIRQLALAMTNYLTIDELSLLVENLAQLIEDKNRSLPAPIAMPRREIETL